MPAPVVVCLCAAWCRLCDGFAPVFDAAVEALRRACPTLQARWIDIEDETELVGDLDIETFPTLLVARAGEVLFAGVLTPQPDVLQRVLGHALGRAAGPATGVDPAFGALARRLADAAPAAPAHRR